jgi:hypothetical protein
MSYSVEFCSCLIHLFFCCSSLEIFAGFIEFFVKLYVGFEIYLVLIFVETSLHLMWNMHPCNFAIWINDLMLKLKLWLLWVVILLSSLSSDLIQHIFAFPLTSRQFWGWNYLKCQACSILVMAWSLLILNSFFLRVLDLFRNGFWKKL